MNPVTLPTSWALDQSPDARTSAPLRRAADRPMEPAHDSDSGPAWSLQRRCALAPRQLAACFVALMLLTTLVAAVFWLHGVRLVAVFSGIELLALGLAFGWHAVHAADGETLQLRQTQLLLVSRRGLACRHERIDRIGLHAGLGADGSIELRTRGRCWQVGRQADRVRRQQVLTELRAAMMHDGAVAPSGT